MHGRGTSTLHVLPQTWSIVLSALYCQHVAIPVYRQLHNSDSRRVNKVLLRSCTALSVMYAVVASCGIVAHGAATPENILLAYPKDHRAASLAQLLTGCSLLVALPLGVQPARDQFPEVLRAWRALFQALARFCRNLCVFSAQETFCWFFFSGGGLVVAWECFLEVMGTHVC